MVSDYIRTCDTCQRYKTGRSNNHGLIPLTGALRDKKPWEKIMVDCAGSWKVRVKLSTGEEVNFTFHMCSMIDSGTGWVEFGAITSASGKNVSQAVEKYWLFSKPRPAECGHDNGPEFMYQELQELLSQYNIKSKPTTIKNPQAQALVERMHHTLTNQLRVKVLSEDTWIDDTDFIMQHCAWVLRTTVPANMHHAPGT